MLNWLVVTMRIVKSEDAGRSRVLCLWVQQYNSSTVELVNMKLRGSSLNQPTRFPVIMQTRVVRVW